MTKKKLRQLYKQKREAVSSELPRISAEISTHLHAYIRETQPRCIAAYLSAQTEPSLDVLLSDCLAMGIQILVPKHVEGAVYALADWVPGQERLGPYGMREPTGPGIAVSPDLWLIPGLAFDKAGTRLGYGKGIYDRLLVGASGTRLGVCPACCVAETLPREVWDVAMHGVVTELGLKLL
jgi:5-formyltetrahydrofolate cyclo-ligase